MSMSKDRRYIIVKNLISTGFIKSFHEIFTVLPKSIAARDLGMNNTRFSGLLKKVDDFLLKDIFLLASFLEIEDKILLDMVYQQYKVAKKSKKIPMIKK